jgi:hypothetical protein
VGSSPTAPTSEKFLQNSDFSVGVRKPRSNAGAFCLPTRVPTQTELLTDASLPQSRIHSVGKPAVHALYDVAVNVHRYVCAGVA